MVLILLNYSKHREKVKHVIYLPFSPPYFENKQTESIDGDWNWELIFFGGEGGVFKYFS